MPFEYDPGKGAANLARHGIDFDAVQALRADPDRVEEPARTRGEPRWALIGRIGARHWMAIFTRRGERIRLISARRSRKEEVDVYRSPGFR
ncbi:MAG: BrnT family toxin [Rhodobacteraceae bacterium]|jgi:uncharacterized DUF497 family protein|nr:BrnT family toxin [Paracoccaceae bacterium]